jgi:hypothetical protein
VSLQGTMPARKPWPLNCIILCSKPWPSGYLACPRVAVRPESDSFASPSHLATTELIPSQPISTFALRVEPSARCTIL